MFKNQISYRPLLNTMTRMIVPRRSMAVQGSSASNIKYVKIGKYDVPARLAKRWRARILGATKSRRELQRERDAQLSMEAPTISEGREARADWTRQTERITRKLSAGLLMDVLQQTRDESQWDDAARTWMRFERHGCMRASKLTSYSTELVAAALRCGTLSLCAAMVVDTHNFKIKPSLHAYVTLVRQVAAEFVPQLLAKARLDGVAARKLEVEVLRRCREAPLHEFGVELVRAMDERGEFGTKGRANTAYALNTALHVLVAASRADDALSLYERNNAASNSTLSRARPLVLAHLLRGDQQAAQQVLTTHWEEFATDIATQTNILIGVAADVSDKEKIVPELRTFFGALEQSDSFSLDATAAERLNALAASDSAAEQVEVEVDETNDTDEQVSETTKSNE